MAPIFCLCFESYRSVPCSQTMVHILNEFVERALCGRKSWESSQVELLFLLPVCAVLAYNIHTKIAEA